MNRKITNTRIFLTKLKDVIVSINFVVEAYDEDVKETFDVQGSLNPINCMKLNVKLDEFKHFKELIKNTKRLITGLISDSIFVMTTRCCVNSDIKVKYLVKSDSGYLTLPKKDYYRLHLVSEEELKNVRVLVTAASDEIGVIKPLEDYVNNYTNTVNDVVKSILDKLDIEVHERKI